MKDHHDGVALRAARAIHDEIRRPFYLYLPKELEHRLECFRAAAPVGVEISYAVMANDNPTLLRWYRARGLDIFVGSLGHLRLARQLGFARQHIIAGLTNLGRVALGAVAEHAQTLLLDTEESIERARCLEVDCEFLVRVDVAEPALLPESGRRMGIPINVVRERWNTWRASDRRLVGVHGYGGTNITDCAVLGDRARALVDFSTGLLGATLVDIGGGFPAGASDGAVVAYLEEFWRRAVPRGLARRRIRVEPGRLLVGSAGYYVCEVTHTEERDGAIYVGTDGCVSEFPRRLAFGARDSDHPLLVATTQPRRAEERSTVVAGCSTFSRDLLWAGSAPEIRVGDILVMKNAGAYCRAATLRFLGTDAPPEFRASMVGSELRIRPLGAIDSAQHLELHPCPGSRLVVTTPNRRSQRNRGSAEKPNSDGDSPCGSAVV